MDGVLFVVMPFGAHDAPQAGVSTMQAQIRADGIPCDIAYLNLEFIKGVGLSSYQATSLTSGELFAGEWLFSRGLYRTGSVDDENYVQEILVGSGVLPPQAIQQIVALAPSIEPFLDHCMGLVDWDRYAIIGFTSMFEQNLPSLALARRIKERYPSKTVVMGGANCFGPMGVQLHRSFGFLDYVFTGESDLAFPAFVRRLRSGQPVGDEIAGCVRRENGSSVHSGPALCLKDLDQLPYPNYDDFYSQYASSGLPRAALQYVLLETGRGCWWGQKNQCRFCGINHNEIPFRTKSPQRALDEMNHMVGRYGMRHLMPVDNILSLDYLKTLMPELARRQRTFSLFYESKANLKEEQVELLARAGVISVQPGVESFSRNVLRLMHKGVSPLQNVQLLKRCRRYGITPLWNLLYGFPGENALDYEINVQFVRALFHLDAPMGFGAVRLERFSPIFERAPEFGIRDVRPIKPYEYVYHLSRSELDNLAYFFSFDFDGKEKADRLFAPLRGELERWKMLPAPATLQVVQKTDDWLVIRDTRPTRVCPEYHFSGDEKKVIEYCDQIRRFDVILNHLNSHLNSSNSGEEQDRSAWLRAFLDSLIAHRLMLRDQDRYLGVVLQPADTSRPQPVAPA